MQIISDRPEVLAILETQGFVAGTTPREHAIGPMHRLGPMLLKAFTQ